jgi:hypothetical protein
MAFFGSNKDRSILRSASSSLADSFRGGAFLKSSIHFSISALTDTGHCCCGVVTKVVAVVVVAKEVDALVVVAKEVAVVAVTSLN